GGDRDTGLDLGLLEDIAAYFREVRKKYAKFEGALRGVDSRILVAQVPGGMLTNLENQLREQGASERLDEVLAEIPQVREDLGYIPLVTPTSQIVGTQAVLNVLTGARYQNITNETKALLKGEYGATPVAVNAELQTRVLEGEAPMEGRPADSLVPEIDTLTAELEKLADEKGFQLCDALIDDVLTYALFPQPGLYFLEHRGDAGAFEPRPELASAAAPKDQLRQPEVEAPIEVYTVNVDGRTFVVEVAEGDQISAMTEVTASAQRAEREANVRRVNGVTVPAALAGNVLKLVAEDGTNVHAGDVVLVLEAMKMETEVTAPRAGIVSRVHVAEGDSVAVGQPLFDLT
ncbi:MAG: oxaloacetate decarboxylase, partial [Gammaproteobacteria bacterium]